MVRHGTDADSVQPSTRRDRAVLGAALGVALLLMGLLTPGCRRLGDPPDGSGACLNGGSSCAAAAAAPGLRQVRKGHRMIRTHWLQKTNKESGVPDIGIQADWAPIRELR
jgi:hypothetical protein